VRFHLKRALNLRFSAKNAFIAILTQALENLQKNKENRSKHK